MSVSFGWAKHPMVNRIDALREDIPITLLYGSRSWVDHSSGELIHEKRQDSHVNIQVHMDRFIKTRTLTALKPKVRKKDSQTGEVCDLQGPLLVTVSSVNFPSHL